MQISVQLFGREGFGYDATPRTLDRVLEEKRGNCLSLSLLYLCAAEKLKMPFRMLPFPKHALIRYDDGAEQFNIEPSMGGMVFVNDAYMRQLYGPPEGISWTLLSKPQTMTMLYSDVGSRLGDQKRHAEAERCFTRAIEINPNYGVAYYNWGTLLAAMNQHALACDKFSRAARLHPHYAEVFNNWGSSLGKLGDFPGACDKFALSAKLDPRSAMAYLNWGVALLALGKREGAIEKFEKAIELQSSLKPFVDEALRQ
jgi:tetratricopeptide (TPR) repeat protein